MNRPINYWPPRRPPAKPRPMTDDRAKRDGERAAEEFARRLAERLSALQSR